MLHLLLRLIAVGMTLALLGGGAAPAGAHDTAPIRFQAGQGLTSTTSTVYEVDPDVPEVRVITTITLSNSGPLVYTGYSLPIFSDAQAVSASNVNAGSLSIVRRSIDNPAFQLAEMSLSPFLAPGQTQTIVLRSTLPAMPARGDGFARVNGAYVTFPVIAVGDPRRVDVNVVVPPGFESTVVGDDLASVTDDAGVTTLGATSIDDPEGFFATVAIFSEERLSSRTVEAAGRTFDILSWPGDDVWSEFVADVVGRGIPALEEGIGVTMPGDQDLRIIQTFSPYLYGYAGWYIPDEGLIEIGDELDGEVVLHELAHVWFNSATFRGRWISEGLAELFAVETATALGLEAPTAIEVDPDDPLAVPLNSWVTPNWFEDQADERERWGYRASFWVLSLLGDEIGLDGVRDVVSSAMEGRDAYGLREPDAARVIATDWRGLLDLFEEVGGSDQASEIFGRFVVTDAERDLLDERSGARTAYLELVDRRDDLTTPRVLRTAMSRWRFGDVDDMVATSLRYLDRLDALERDATALGLTLPAMLVDDYEQADEVDTLHDGADAAESAIGSLELATEAADRSGGPLAAVGGWFLSPDDDLEAARSAFERGSWGRAEDHAAQAHDDYERLPTIGLIAVAGALTLLVIAAGGTVVASRLRRRRRRAQSRPVPVTRH